MSIGVQVSHEKVRRHAQLARHPPPGKPLGVSNPRTRVPTRSGCSLRSGSDLVPSLSFCSSPSTCRWPPTRRSRESTPVSRTRALISRPHTQRYRFCFSSLLRFGRYKDGGPAAIANFEAGVEGFTTRAFRGCGVTTSDPFEVSDGKPRSWVLNSLSGGRRYPHKHTESYVLLFARTSAEMEAVQMLQRFTQVGEFYVMSTPEGIGDAATMIGFMDVLIYDEEADRHVKITYRSALENTGVTFVKPDGTVEVLKVNGTPVIDGATVIGKDAAGADMSLTQFATSASDLLKANETAATTIGGEGLKGACVVLARPFIEHAMLSAVLTVSGGDTGATIFGPSDMYAAQHTLKIKLTNSRSMLPPPHSNLKRCTCNIAGKSRPTHLSRRSKGTLAFEPAHHTRIHFTVISKPRPLCVLAATTPATSRRSSPSTRTCS